MPSSPIPPDEMLKNEEIGPTRCHTMGPVKKLHTGHPLEGCYEGYGVRNFLTGPMESHQVDPISSIFDISSNQVQLTGVDSKWHN